MTPTSRPDASVRDSWIGTRQSRSPAASPRRCKALFPLHAILDVEVAAAAGWEVPQLAQAFLEGGAKVIQLRAKRLPSGAFLAHIDDLVRAAAPFRTSIIVNDRVDLALMGRASGVHVGQEDLPPAAARQLLGADAVIGYSTHTVAQIDAAAAEPISYLAVGPVFGTQTKETGYAAVGLALVAEAARRSRGRPVVAIGGITLERAPEVLAAGASSVAVITDLLAAGDPSSRVAAYLKALGL